MTVNPDEVFERFRTLGERWAKLDGIASSFEEMRRSKRAQIMTAFGDMSVSKAEMLAESDPAYIEHIEKMVESRTQANIARAEFDALKVWIDLIRSQEASKREELRRLGG